MNNESAVDTSQDQQSQINQIIIDYIREQKRKRRWQLLFRSLALIFILFVLYQILTEGVKAKQAILKPHVGLIDLKGTISDTDTGNADNFAQGLEKAYKSDGLKALIIRINSPGGSPVQAEYMFNAIRHYQGKYPKVKVYAVCVDLCASAAYYVAAAADEIYASPASMVGSIGVLYNGFGFVDSLQKLGMTRRLVTAGSNKGFLDPFSPVDTAQEQKLQTMLDLIHKQFIDRVKEGRGSRLHEDEDTFSGLFWTGEQSLSRGLIDGFASTGQLAREVIKLDEVIDYTYKPNYLDQFAKNLGASLVSALTEALGLQPAIR